MLYQCHLVYFFGKCYSFLSQLAHNTLFDKLPNLDVTLPSERNVARSASNCMFLPTKSCLLQWKSMPIFTLVLLLLVLVRHECGLFPRTDVWDGGKGHLARASEFLYQLEAVIVIDKPLGQLFFVPSCRILEATMTLTPHTCYYNKTLQLVG